MPLTLCDLAALSAHQVLLLHGFQVLHIHVLFAAPLCSSHMAKPGTDQHQFGCGCCSSVRPIPFGPRLSVFRLRLRLSSSARPTGRTLHLQLCPLPPSRYSAFPQAACRYRAPICDPGGISSPSLSQNADLWTLRSCQIWKQIRSLLPICAAYCLKNYLHSQSSLLDSCSHFTIRPALRQMCEVLFLMKRSSSHSSGGSSNNCALA